MAPSRRYLLVLIGVFFTILAAQAQMVVVDSTDVTVDEDAGSVTIIFTHTPAPNSIWGLQYDTWDITATAGQDYVATDGVAFRTTATTTISVTITIIDDEIYDPDETFVLEAFGISPGPPTINVTITIIDNETPPVNLTEIDDAMIKETVGNFCFPISRSDSTTHAFNVTISTMDIDIGISATEGEDYTGLSNYTVSFAENEDSVTVCIPIINDLLAEPPETFDVWVATSTYWTHFNVTIKDNDTPDNFHCGRGISQPCLNGAACTFSDGTCACLPGFEGENCGIATDNITDSCSLDCVNGTCVDDGAGDMCVCGGGYTGDLCQYKAYFHQCEAHGISVCITPFSVDTFNGTIYVVGQYGVSDCTLQLAPNPTDPDDFIVDWCMGRAAFIGYNGTCGELGPTIDGTLTTFVLELRVQYTTSLRATDELVTFTCQYDNGSLQLSTGVNSVNPDGDHVSVQRETGDLVPAKLIVTDANGLALPDFLKIGKIVKIYVSVEKVDTFEAVVIDRIIANNGRTGADFRSLVLYNHGCFPADAFGIIIKGPIFVPETEKHTKCFEIEVFIFSHDVNEPNPKLQIVIEFTVYIDADDAVKHECGSRRRRQAVESREDQMDTTIYIVNPDAVQTGEISATCETSKWLVPTIIGLGVVAITMAIVIIALTVAVCRHYQDKKLL